MARDRLLRSPNLEKRVAGLERLVGLLIDLVAVAFGVGGALFVAGDYYRLNTVEGASDRFTSKAEIDATQNDVCFVPKADIDRQKEGPPFGGLGLRRLLNFVPHERFRYV